MLLHFSNKNIIIISVLSFSTWAHVQKWAHTEDSIVDLQTQWNLSIFKDTPEMKTSPFIMTRHCD